ncbi:MAG: zinc ribbon domain-containing protein [Lachnospiraceae bacterium]|nr:zinc ribbon domain-containing protein [Lachnospiraceae bacterium]
MAFCMNCGAQIPDGAGFCNNCGTALNTGAQAAPQEAMQPQSGMQYQQPPMQPQSGMQYQQPQMQQQFQAAPLMVSQTRAKIWLSSFDYPSLVEVASLVIS